MKGSPFFTNENYQLHMQIKNVVFVDEMTIIKVKTKAITKKLNK